MTPVTYAFTVAPRFMNLFLSDLSPVPWSGYRGSTLSAAQRVKRRKARKTQRASRMRNRR